MKGYTMQFSINGYLVLSTAVGGPLTGRLGVYQYDDTPATLYVDWAQAGKPVLLPSAQAAVPEGSLIRALDASEQVGFTSRH